MPQARDPTRCGTFSVWVLTVSLGAYAAAALLTCTTIRGGAPETKVPPLVCRSAFSVHECGNISKLFVTSQLVEHDVRIAEGVHRTNRWDSAKGMQRAGQLDWIYERIIDCAGLNTSALAFRSTVEFSLMHEFTAGGFFDWHVDTKPGDGTGRTFNVNVMLSVPGRDFGGGAFLLGAKTVALEQGDLYIYPASYPHAVEGVVSGRRRTLVVAVIEPDVVNEPSANVRARGCSECMGARSRHMRSTSRGHMPWYAVRQREWAPAASVAAYRHVHGASRRRTRPPGPDVPLSCTPTAALRSASRRRTWPLCRDGGTRHCTRSRCAPPTGAPPRPTWRCSRRAAT